MSRFRFKLLLPSKTSILPILLAGLVAGIVNVSYGIAYAAIIFSGDLASHLSTGIGLGLFSAAVLLTATALISSLQGTIANIQEVPTLLLSLIVSDITLEMASGNQLPTVLVLIATTTFLFGTVSLLLGTFRLGNLIRFIPYPVIGGFLAGTGWFLSLGALLMLTRLSALESMSDLTTHAALLQWVPGFIFAVLLLWLQRRFGHPLTLPGMLLGSLALFFLFLGITQTPLAQVEELGLLLGPFTESAAWQPLHWQTLTQADWGLMARQGDQLFVLLVVVLMASLLNVTSLEVVVRQDMRLNRELQATGIANILSGLSGGLIGFHGLGLSALCKARLGGHSRFSGILAALVVIAVLLFGSASVAQIPRFMIGGLLLYLGLDFLWDWVWLARRNLPFIDYLTVLAILLMMMVRGVLPAVGLGIALSILAFLFNYSQLSIVRHHLSGQTLSSHVDREPLKQKALQEMGTQIQILQLQGYLFFGSAQQLLSQVRNLIQPISPSQTQFIVLDFRQVLGMDSSVVYSFLKLKQTAPAHLKIVLADLKPAHQQLLIKAACLVADDAVYRLSPDLDQGLEWCEEKLLEEVEWRRKRFMPLAMLLEPLFSDPEQIGPFMTYLAKVELMPDATLFKIGEAANQLYFLEFGQVTTFVSSHQRRQVTFRDGTVIGATAFFTGEPHTVTAIAQQPSIFHVLDRDRWQAMLQEHPKAAAIFQEALLAQLSGRLERTHRDLDTLLA